MLLGKLRLLFKPGSDLQQQFRWGFHLMVDEFEQLVVDPAFPFCRVHIRKTCLQLVMQSCVVIGRMQKHGRF